MPSELRDGIDFLRASDIYIEHANWQPFQNKAKLADKLSTMKKSFSVFLGEILLGLVVSACAGRAASVYTNEADFVNALGASQSFLNDFNDLTISEQYVHPLQYVSNGLAYRITSNPSLQIWSLIGAVSTTVTNVVIVTTFTSTNVHAVGGWFFLTDTNDAATGGSVSLALNGNTVAVVPSSTNGPMFWGYVSGGPLLTNLAIQSDTAGGYPTLDHFNVAEGEPVFSPLVMAANSLVLSWPAPSTGYQLQTSTNLAGTNWTSVVVTPQNTNHQMQVSVPISGPLGFYRLVK